MISAVTDYCVYPTSGSSGSATYVPYKQNGLSYENYNTAALARVAVHPFGSDDTAYIYPSDATGNTLHVMNNTLLSGASASVMNTVAQNIYTTLSALGSYRPARANLFTFDNPFRAGQLVNVTDAQGVSFVMPVMKMRVSPTMAQITATGNETYDETETDIGKTLLNLAAEVVQIDRLKVGWAEIEQAIINVLEVSGELTVKDANGDIVFKASVPDKTVQIGGFNVTSDTLGSDTGYIQLYEDSNQRRWMELHEGAALWYAPADDVAHPLRGYIGMVSSLNPLARDGYLHIDSAFTADGIKLGYYGGSSVPIVTINNADESASVNAFYVTGGAANVRLLGKRTTIPNNADLNSDTYKYVGCYAQHVGTNSVSNAPRTSGAFILDIENATGTDTTGPGTWRYYRQRLMYADDTTEYTRILSSDGSGTFTYGQWVAK